MKKTIIMLNLAFVFMIGLAMLNGCGTHEHDGEGHSHDKTNTEESNTVKETPPPAVEEKGIEFTSAYVCPMHCKGSGSAAPGKCPVCKMDYVKNENHDTDGQESDGHDHDGHDHGDHEGHDHG